MKKLCILIFLAISINGISQAESFSIGEVITIILLADQSYSVIHEQGTENFYKTSPHQSGELIEGQIIELKFYENANNVNVVEVISPSLNNVIFCQLIEPNGAFSSLIPLITNQRAKYTDYVSFNPAYNVLVFRTWNDVGSLELLIENNRNNFVFNQGNENRIFQIFSLIRQHG